MDKTAIYEALRADGARLKAINFYTEEQLSDLYAERFGNEPEIKRASTEQKPCEVRTLYFAAGGWCAELERSFAQGYYRPASVDEYQALKKYSTKEV